MKQLFTIESNRQVAKATFEMCLAGDTSAFTMPGQFADVAVPGKYLRRPISISDFVHGHMTIVYKVVGSGTELLSRMRAGETVECLTGLGHGFDADAATAAPLLVGGGLGAAPLLNLAKCLLSRGLDPVVVLGFNTADEIVCADKFRELGLRTYIATMDGSEGVKGFVTDAIRQNEVDFDYFYTCGPKPMMKALALSTDKPGEISMEERMGCGFGICMGCTIQTAAGPARVCKDGPVFKKEDIIW